MLNQYAGNYEQGMNFIRAGDSLYVDMGTKKIRLHATTNESFYLPGSNGIAEFVKDDKGKATGITFKTADGTYHSKKLD